MRYFPVRFRLLCKSKKDDVESYQLLKPIHLYCVKVVNTWQQDESQQTIRRDEKIREDISDALKTDNSTITSCTALYSMALWPGLSSVSSVLQHLQWAASLISGHWRSLSAAGERPKCSGFSLHSFSTVSWQAERNTVVKVQLAEILQKYLKNVDLQQCPLKSWITFEKPGESIQKLTTLHTKSIWGKGHIFHQCLSSSFLKKSGS